MKHSAIIIDDERLARAELKRLLENHELIEIVDEAANVDEALEKIKTHQPEIIFLDIQMPEKTGFDLLTELDHVPLVIFTTAYDEYAIKAFEVNAIDYLMKPIDPKRLEEAIAKLNLGGNNLKTLKGGLSEFDQVFVKDGEKCWFVQLGDIKMFESVGNYAKVYFGTNKPLILKSLNALEEKLDERLFFRANRKTIVNLKMVAKVEPYFNGGFILELKDGDKVEVSRRQAVKFRDTMSL
jgi:two-component system, LytTR family, response regulator